MKLIPLHIAMDYPVNWDFERILRDLVQNFYDAIGCERFKEERYRKMTEKKNELSQDVKKEIGSLLVLLDEEKTKDIISFLTKYPALSEVQLAKRILRESEYWH